MCRTRQLTLLLTLFLWIAESVDRSNFKTCSESSFCKRHRKPSILPPSYVALPETISFEDLSFVVHLENTVNKKRLKLYVSSYGDGRLGVMLDEIDPIRARFRAHDVFVRPPIKRGFRDSKLDRESAELLTLDNHKILVHFHPFRIDVLDQGDLVTTLNSQGLLKFEHFREKPQKQEETSSESTTEGPLRRFILGPILAMWRSIFGSKSKTLQQIDTANEHHEANTVEPSPLADAPIPDANEESSKPPEKSQSDDAVSKTDEEKKATVQNEPSEEQKEEGFWEEHYKSHFDSKPYGASSVGMDISLVGFKYAYGIPEHADSFALKSTTNSDPYRLYNLDVFEYEIQSPMSLYGAIPYILGHSEERTVGILWLNPSETWIDIKNSFADKSMFRSLLDKFKADPEVPQVDSHWISESGLIDIYIFLGPTPADTFRQYTEFFGTTPLPPMFSIGYHQCRWNYNDMDDVNQVDANFDVYDMPVDTIWLDIEHTDGKRYFTWEPHKFSDPKAMIDGLASKSRRLVTIVDPHIKNDDNYYIYKEAKELGHFVKNRDGNDFEGWCWCGSSMYLDFLNPTVRDWWASQYAFDKYNGTTEYLHIWNDMNEPSVFNGPEVTMHKDNKHYGGWEHREVHNMYGFYNHMATYKGLLRRTHGQKRPFILTRSFFVGSQRYTSVWTGDNAAEWSHLQITFPMLLSLSVAGIPFVGADVGGFFKNPDEELLVRWYQNGAFNPFYRAHAHVDTKRREPWLLSENARNLIRDALRLRYTMLPYWYTLFYKHVLTGLPVLRPMWIEFPKDPVIFSEEKQAMLGSSILVRPIVEQGATSASVYLPGEKQAWYDRYTMRKVVGPGVVTVDAPLSQIPILIRGGSIVPFKMTVRRASSLGKHDPLTLFVALDDTGKIANGTFYYDDGETFDYQRNLHCYRRFEYFGNEVSGVLTSRKITGDLCETKMWLEQVVFMGLRFHPAVVTSQNYEGNLVFYFNVETRVMTVRKPAFNVGADWSMQISSSRS